MLMIERIRKMEAIYDRVSELLEKTTKGFKTWCVI